MLDARGHGESSRLPAGAPYDAAADIADAIDRLGLRAPVVMGHSVGARAVADYAAASPAGVSKVVLEDPPFLPLPEPSAAEARRAKFCRHVETFLAMSNDQIIAAGRASSPLWHADEFSDWAAAKKQVDPMAFPAYALPWQDSAARIHAPTLIIFGEAARGGLVTAEIANEACAINPNIGAVQIKGAGHNIRRENFRDFVWAVRAFLAA